jgi:hypothetical protein
LLYTLFLPQKLKINESTNFSGEPIIKQLLKLLSIDIIPQFAKGRKIDRYYERFQNYGHLVTMRYATLSGVNSFMNYLRFCLPVLAD